MTAGVGEGQWGIRQGRGHTSCPNWTPWVESQDLPTKNLQKAADEKHPSGAKWRHEVRATQWLVVRTALCRVRVGESWVISS
jgi:hypothetical protein